MYVIGVQSQSDEWKHSDSISQVHSDYLDKRYSQSGLLEYKYRQFIIYIDVTYYYSDTMTYDILLDLKSYFYLFVSI